jgi:hypothetical protein
VYACAEYVCYSGVEGKVGLIFAKAAALRINISTDGSPVAMGRTHITHGSHAPGGSLYTIKLKSVCREPDLSLAGLDPVP